jgi:hypothetical protein
MGRHYRGIGMKAEPPFVIHPELSVHQLRIGHTESDVVYADTEILSQLPHSACISRTQKDLHQTGIEPVRPGRAAPRGDLLDRYPGGLRDRDFRIAFEPRHTGQPGVL